PWWRHGRAALDRPARVHLSDGGSFHRVAVDLCRTERTRADRPESARVSRSGWPDRCCVLRPGDLLDGADLHRFAIHAVPGGLALERDPPGAGVSISSGSLVVPAHAPCALALCRGWGRAIAAARRYPQRMGRGGVDHDRTACAQV